MATEREIIELIAGDRSLVEVLAAIARFVEGQLPGAGCCVAVLDDPERRLRVVAAPTVAARVLAELDGADIRSLAGPIGAAARARELVVSGELAAAPILTPGETLLGVIAVKTCGDAGATPCLATLTAAGNLASVTIQHEQHSRALRLATARMHRQRQIEGAILTGEAPQAIAQSVLSYLVTEIPCRRAGVVLFDPRTGNGEVLAAWGVMSDQIPPGTVLRAGHMGGVPDEIRWGGASRIDMAERAARVPEVAALWAAGLRTWVVTPLIAHGVLIGALNLWSDRDDAYTPAHLTTATDLAGHLAVALRQCQLLEQLREEAVSLESRVRERTAELEAARHEMETFSYSVSHDLRAPLRTIHGFTSILIEDHGTQLSPAAHALLAAVTMAAEEMNGVIDALLRLAHLGQQTLRWDVVDLTALAREVVADLRAADSTRTVDVAITLGLVVDGDRALLHILLSNLVSNAWKYTRERTVGRIEIAALADGAPGFVVCDNGAGFDAARADRLFTPFQRLHRAERFEGIGIGLATAQRIAQRHGGMITAESVEGTGASFSVRLGSKPR